MAINANKPNTSFIFWIGISATLFFACQSGQTQESFYTLEDFSKVPKVDVHVHINTRDNALVEQAEKDNFILLTINVEVPDYPTIDQQLDYALGQKEYLPERVYFLSTFETETLEDEDWHKKVIASLQASKEKGSLGVKMWKNIGMVIKDEKGDFIKIDHPKFDPVFQYLEKKQHPCMWSYRRTQKLLVAAGGNDGQ